MSILIGQHEFEGPVTDLAEVPLEPGLYAVLQEHINGCMLVDVDNVNNLNQALADRFQAIEAEQIVILKCWSPFTRKNILNEIVREFEFDEHEQALKSTNKKRVETNKGIAIAIS